MIYAQVKNGIVMGTIILDDPSLIPIFSRGYDYFLQIDDSPGSPGTGWLYDGTTFTPPPPQDEGQQWLP